MMDMPVSVRLKKDEQRALEVKCREINKVLIENDQKPIQESELVHIILDQCIKRATLNNRFWVVVE